MRPHDQRLYEAIQCVIRETRGFNERKQEAWCRVCRYKGTDRLHDPECPIYELHGAYDGWAPLARAEAQPAANVVAEDPSKQIQIDHCRADLLRLTQEREQLQHGRACQCSLPDPVMQADGKFYCHVCSSETGARPRGLEPEQWYRELQEAKAERDALIGSIRGVVEKWQDAAVWEHDDMSNTQSAQTFDQCAAELLALLPPSSGGSA